MKLFVSSVNVHMSRIGKRPVLIPPGVQATLTDDQVHFTGPKGSLVVPLHERIVVSRTGEALHITVTDPEAHGGRALWGLYGALIKNALDGVSTGHTRSLEIHGVGFKAQMKGRALEFELGFSHPVEFVPPEGVEVKVEKNTITVSGVDKQLVGEAAARIRMLRKPEPYKGKGIRYVGEVVRKKAGKAAKTAAAG